MDLNKATLIGRLTRDPETKTIPSGQQVTTFGLATNRVYTDQTGQKQEFVEFHNIVAWRRLAEICAQYLHKGSKIYLEGRLQTRSWDGQDGIKRYRTEIVAENMIMLDTKSAGMPTSSAPQSIPSAPETTPQNFEPTPASSESEIPSIQISPEEAVPANEVNVEEVPF